MRSSLSEIAISPCETYHLKQEKPLYAKKFFKVLKYHEPGLAPVIDKEGAYHINLSGEEAYSHRFKRTFGFYNGRAAVESLEGCFHILPEGSSLYEARYTWCGNFQEGACAVQNKQGQYFHIDLDGHPLYEIRYAYVGDFKEGVAVVCNEKGKHTHIDLEGDFLHNQWFDQLDVYHKGFARAKDANGWFHVDKKGNSIYKERYANIEPFYNGLSYIEDFERNLFRINETGEIIEVIAYPSSSERLIGELSNDMVGFWKTWTLYTAITLKVPDHLPSNQESIADTLQIPLSHIKRLFKALWELDIVKPGKNDIWKLTEKGKLLKPVNDSFISAAGVMWGHVNKTWENLPNLIKDPVIQYRPSFKEQEQDDELLGIYHRALDGYTEKDFLEVLSFPFWKSHHRFVGFGRSSLTLISHLLEKYKHLEGIVFGSEKTIGDFKIPLSLGERFQKEVGDINKIGSMKVDAVLFPRFLHYFPDDDVQYILSQTKSFLDPKGSIYIMEMILEETRPMGGLFDLNMLVESGGKVRSLGEWQDLFLSSQLVLEEVQKISPILTILKLAPLS